MDQGNYYKTIYHLTVTEHCFIIYKMDYTENKEKIHTKLFTKMRGGGI